MYTHCKSDAKHPTSITYNYGKDWIMKQNKEKMERPAPWPDPPEKISKLDIGDYNGDLQSIYAIENKINEIIDFINPHIKKEIK